MLFVILSTVWRDWRRVRRVRCWSISVTRSDLLAVSARWCYFTHYTGNTTTRRTASFTWSGLRGGYSNWKSRRRRCPSTATLRRCWTFCIPCSPQQGSLSTTNIMECWRRLRCLDLKFIWGSWDIRLRLLLKVKPVKVRNCLKTNWWRLKRLGITW